ncbi:hypothetical protein Mgra_00009929 [Meloidogyne graminicola]|uniref:Uncharacterized protein n=1 Tax=Meloidogyne graminicola TaxID=189291 RepID=A0A8S9ZBL7_9BILA|nr:hypothetical protein Mgra_00009929 [Meloidogyne graminicola]
MFCICRNKINGYSKNACHRQKNCCSSVKKRRDTLEEMCCLCRKCKSSSVANVIEERQHSINRFWIDVNFVEATGRCCPRCSMWEIRMWYKSDVKAKAGVAQIRKKRIL